MKFRFNKWFFLFAFALLLSDFTFVVYSYYSYKSTMMSEIRDMVSSSERSFNVGIGYVSDTMKQVVTYIASEQDILLLFYGGMQAVEAEGGGKGGARAESYREELYDRVVDSWAELKSRYDIRQLHFFVGKGATSFLRVHKPARFGDDLSNERITIVDANTSLIPTGGFEIGRADAGIRGAIPVFFDTGNGKYVHVGALEAGTSFNGMIKNLGSSMSMDIAVYTSFEKLRNIMWPSQIESRLSMNREVGGYLIDSYTDDSLLDMVDKDSGASYFKKSAVPVLFEEGGRHFFAGSFPYYDYISVKNGLKTPTGYVVIRKDITPMYNKFESSVRHTAVLGVIAYLIIIVVFIVTWELASRKFIDIIDERTAELKASKEEAEALSRVKSDFLANMSHEIRTPMNCILGFADILSKRNTDPTNRKYLENMTTSGNTLLTLINDILDLSKIESGKFSVNEQACDAARIVRDIEKTFSYPAESKGLDLTVVIDPSVPRSLIMDDIRFRQILLNITGNAVKYTDKGFVKMHLWAEPMDDSTSRTELVFSVSDSGIGISDEMQEKIFDAFEQQQRPDMAKYGGTGLGLAITKKLVRLMNGKINVYSRQGEGTVMTVRFKDVPIAATLAPGYGGVRLSYSFAPAKVLIIDDIPLNRELLGEYLDGFGFDIRYAGDGSEGMEIMRDFIPDILLVDMRMPVMTGFELVNTMRGDGRLKNIPVIAITASSIHDTVEEIKRVCDSYLHKPVSRDQLLSEMAKYLHPEVTEHAGASGTKECVDMSFFENVTDREGLIEQLESELMPVWRELKDILPFEEVVSFSADVKQAGIRHECEGMVIWADKVSGHISMFEMDSLAKVFAKFNTIYEILKKGAQ